MTEEQLVHAHNELEKAKCAILKQLDKKLAVYDKKIVNSDGTLTKVAQRNLAIQEPKMTPLPGEYIHIHRVGVRCGMGGKLLFLTLTIRAQSDSVSCFYRSTSQFLGGVDSNGYLEFLARGLSAIEPALTTVEEQRSLCKRKSEIEKESSELYTRIIEDFPNV